MTRSSHPGIGIGGGAYANRPSAQSRVSRQLIEESSGLIPVLLAQVSAGFTAIVDQHLGTDWAENPEILALLALRLHPAPTTRQLAERSGLNRRAVNRLVHRLRDDGLVDTDRSPGDHRAVIVTLTGQGQSRYDALSRALDVHFDSAVATAGRILVHLGGAPATTSARLQEPLATLEQLAAIGSLLVAGADGCEGPVELSGRQRVALVQIVTAESVRPTDLGTRLGAEPPTITYVIDQLVARGLIIRHRSTGADRRATVLTATETGQQAARVVEDAVRANARELSSIFAAIARRERARSELSAAPR